MAEGLSLDAAARSQGHFGGKTRATLFNGFCGKADCLAHRDLRARRNHEKKKNQPAGAMSARARRKGSRDIKKSALGLYCIGLNISRAGGIRLGSAVACM